MGGLSSPAGSAPSLLACVQNIVDTNGSWQHPSAKFVLGSQSHCPGPAHWDCSQVPHRKAPSWGEGTGAVPIPLTHLAWKRRRVEEAVPQAICTLICLGQIQICCSLWEPRAAMDTQGPVPALTWYHGRMWSSPAPFLGSTIQTVGRSTHVRRWVLAILEMNTADTGSSPVLAIASELELTPSGWRQAEEGLLVLKKHHICITPLPCLADGLRSCGDLAPSACPTLSMLTDLL